MANKIINLFKKPFYKKILNWYKTIKEYQYLRKIIQEKERKNIINKSIVINATRIQKTTFDTIVLIGTIFALNGAKVKILLDDGILKHTDIYRRSVLPRDLKNFEKKNINPYFYFKNQKNLLDALIYRSVMKHAFKTYKVENLEYIFFSEIFNNNNIKVDCKNLEDDALSSTMRFFETCELDFNTREVQYYYKLSLLNAILLKKLGVYILNTLKPDLYITYHGIYTTHGPAYDFLKENGIKSIIYVGVNKRAKVAGQIHFTDAKSQTMTKDTYWQLYKNTPVTEKMIKIVKDFFEDRINLTAYDNTIYYTGNLKPLVVDKNDGYKYHIAIFPNVIWDGSIKERHNVFDGYLDWLLTTINLLRNHKEIKLYIRAHPSETTMWKNSEKILDILNKYVDFKSIKNFVLIPSHKKFNTYDFIKSGIDLGLVYDGTLAFELPLLKVPAIACVNGGRFTVEGGNYIAKSKEQYKEYLNNIDGIIKNFHENYEKYYRNIVRFLYWYIHEIHVDFPVKNHDGINIYNLKKENLELDKKLLKILEIYTK